MKRFVCLLFCAMCAVSQAEETFGGGRLFTGVNYWASHAGMYMWRNWNAETVERDLAELEKWGVTTLRVFPLWPDFQPLTRMIGTVAPLTEGVLQNDRPLANPAGVDETMMARFRFLCDAAERHRMKLVVGLVTGWMSGRRFVPVALEDKNPITNPECVKWEVRFVKHFVSEMRDHPAIAAWNLGNECNTMGGGRDEFWCWMNAIAGAIRAADPTRPVVAGMHGITSERAHPWNGYCQGELLDVLTTHPYPLFVPECSHEPFDTMRNELHGTAESVWYSGMSGKPCFIEEAGNLSANVASDDRTAASVRLALFNAWTHGRAGYLWWCAFDQTHLDFPPYTGSALERGLGLLRADYSPKPVAKAMKEVRDFVDAFPYRALPPHRTDATVLFSEMEGCWPQALGAFLLAKEAGFDVRFASAEQPLPESKFYILVSGKSDCSYTQTAWLRVLGKVRAGATLLVTKAGDFMLSDFREITGTEIEWMYRAGESRTFELKDFPGRKITVGDGATVRWTAKTSEVLAADAAGNPILTAKAYGKGQVLAFNGPLEADAAKKGDGFTGENVNPRYLVYRVAAARAGVRRTVVKKDSPLVGLTEHPLPDGNVLVFAANYEPRPVTCPIAVNGTVAQVLRGKAKYPPSEANCEAGAMQGADELTIPANDVVCFTVAPKADVLTELVPKPITVERLDGLSTAENVRVVRGAVEGAPAAVADQAYVLEIGKDGACITASGAAGERYARMTLEQLRKLAEGSVPCCRIVDWPALKWRGYMNDCGRNYLALEGVKAIIDTMAKYKMNLFHWHLSDYHGWRLESKKYPQLQRKEAFRRQIGRYYTQEEFREIIAYAAARGITVMPELDVPGHSLALRTGLGIDSMKAEGTDKIVSDLFEELCSLAPADVMPFIHLGTDEVRTKPEFCDESWPTKWVKTINAQGRRAVVWAPGKKIDAGCDVIDMAWYDNHITNAVNDVFDSARVYNTSWGPFDILPHAAYTKMCRWRTREGQQIGAITCTWHDDNVGDDTLKLFRECMVFPVIVAMGDNFWAGRATDEPALQNRLPAPNDPRFAVAADLERRIIAQRDRVLKDLGQPFPFLRQTDRRWRLTDAETGKVIASDVAQGSVWLWHFQRKDTSLIPAGEGHVVAETWVWSPRDIDCGAWIDFMNLNGVYGRLDHSCTPKTNTWDNYGSSISLNGVMLPPPAWKNPGAKSKTSPIREQNIPYSTDLLEVPLVDEMPTLRAPYPIRLKAGWNHVKLDLPKPKGVWGRFWLGIFAPFLGTSEHPVEIPGLIWSAEGPISL